MEARKLRNRAAWFTVVEEELYCWEVSEGAPLQLYVLGEEGKSIMSSAHCGANGTHQGGRTLARQVAHQGYHWPKLNKTAEEMAQTCDEC